MSEELPRADVVIAGAGPAGVACAIELTRRGVRDVLLLDALDFPRDKTCGSGLSPRCVDVLRELDIWDRVAPHAYKIDGLTLQTMRGHTVDLPSDGIDVYVCLRRILDHAMLKAAIDGGVHFIPRFKAASLIEEGGRVRGVVADDGRIARGRYTVIATGAHSRMAIDVEKRHVISTIMGWWEGVPFRPHWMEMYYDAAIAPYYGWLFPEDDQRVNIGITYADPEVKQNAKTLFEGFLTRCFGDRLKDAKRIGAYRGHPIVFDYQLPRLTSPGRIVIGEAGRMTHPATGEGISQGMRSGMYAAQALAGILEAGGSERLAFAGYEARCRATFTPSFLAGGAFLKIANTPVFDGLASLSKDPRIGAVTRNMFTHM